MQSYYIDSVVSPFKTSFSSALYGIIQANEACDVFRYLLEECGHMIGKYSHIW